LETQRFLQFWVPYTATIYDDLSIPGEQDQSVRPQNRDVRHGLRPRMAYEGCSDNRRSAMRGDLLPNHFKGLSGICDLVDHRNTLPLDIVGDWHPPNRVGVPYFIAFATGQTNRKELTTESTRDRSSGEQTRASYSNHELDSLCVQP
jgi:hypothetical protein